MCPLSLSAETLPSGRDATLFEVLTDTVGAEAWLRFRFLAPDISTGSGTVDPDQIATDMDALCADVALAYVSEHELTADKVAISLSDREVPFGSSDPDATQFFEVYALRDGRCIWEAF
jgi:hypothetical protein